MLNLVNTVNPDIYMHAINPCIFYDRIDSQKFMAAKIFGTNLGYY